MNGKFITYYSSIKNVKPQASIELTNNSDLIYYGMFVKRSGEYKFIRTGKVAIVEVKIMQQMGTGLT